MKSVIIPIKERGNVITGFLSLRILIDDRKRMEEEKNIYLKSLESMLFIVSHEIRKPITGCQGILNLLTQERGSLSEEEYNDAVSYLASSASELDGYSRKLNEYIEHNIKIANQ